MAYRFTNTDKWNDSWFSNLKPIEKLLFMYLCDNCDIAGFIEVNTRRWAVDINTDTRGIEGALKGLDRGIMYSSEKDCIYIRNFLKHQKNFPINPDNKAHQGIIYRFDNYIKKFQFTEYNEFIEAATKGLNSPIGRGIGKGMGLGEDGNGGTGEKPEEKKITWRNDFETYLLELRHEYQKIISDDNFILSQEKYYPDVDIRLSLEKSCVNFWSTEAGWKNKKNSKSRSIDWIATFKNTLTIPANKVYKHNGTHQRVTTRTEQVNREAAETLASINARL